WASIAATAPAAPYPTTTTSDSSSQVSTVCTVFSDASPSRVDAMFEAERDVFAPARERAKDHVAGLGRMDHVVDQGHLRREISVRRFVGLPEKFGTFGFRVGSRRDLLAIDDLDAGRRPHYIESCGRPSDENVGRHYPSTHRQI